jgi:hypothetical protein
MDAPLDALLAAFARRRGPFYTLGELSLQDRASWIRYEMDRLHDRVRKVKDVVPPEPPGPRPWWKSRAPHP